MMQTAKYSLWANMHLQNRGEDLKKYWLFIKFERDEIMKTRFRKLTAWVLTLAMLMTFMPATAFAVVIPSHASHPICGAEHSDIGDHTGTCEAVDWTAWDGKSDLAADGNYYLADNAEITSTIDVEAEVNLCLNGKVIEYTGSTKGSVFRVKKKRSA